MGFLEINWTSAAMLMLFVLMVYFLNKFLYTPFIEMAEKRKKKVESDLKSAEELKKEAEKMKEEAEKQLLEARQRADEIVESARREAETIVEDAREKAKKEAQSIIDSAKAQIEVEYKRALEQIQERAAELSVVMATKLLQRVFQDERAKREYLIKILKEEIEKS
ncbi:MULTISPECIES: F0F1 ATP synthase subunit B [Thermotoga]|uniref:ATP synthase subunit b n=2 Tax=Thermotoga neapolitana TaxID=2337 RepID=B9K7T7_THENN|nr:MULTISPECIES: F0F1 ATP synthase subunit B [Thermotoga]ACM23020.1 ATP synthase B chain [Thermotoga neapolitana DSM 4359]AJG40937.1 ATP synthase subunit B [Thermotoga sp. RQ7]HBF10448.1 ATP synthase F0 subunit B [Thermotoga neapolitana]